MAPTTTPVTKISQIRAAMQAGDWDLAFRLAARLPQLGRQRGAILTARGALVNPQFYREMGRDLDQLVALGRAAMVERFSGKTATAGSPSLEPTCSATADNPKPAGQ